ncbi:MAG: amidohydrolase family protein [Chloroflexia bacterium]
MLLQNYTPQPTLVTPSTSVPQPAHPVIDAHNHLDTTFGGGWINRPVSELLDVLDQANVRTLVDLDGGWGEHILHTHLDHFKAAAPDRFQIFGGVDWQLWPSLANRFPDHAATSLRQQVARGAQGLKIWKPFGLTVRDYLNTLVPVDDPRLDPLWATAAELRIPVLIHAADPVAFFQPIDDNNERIEELAAHPDWHFPSPPYPSFLSILDALSRLVARHPATTFIGAHVGCYAENLAYVANMLTTYPNYYIDISARLAELGRQPYTTRRFFIDHADRILFGTDMPPSLPRYQLHYRFLESADEYFPYSLTEPPTQGRWRIYGLHLPDDVLEKIYFTNAQRILLPK